ncbi:gamma-glutamylcyclotransferase [Mesorhizobium sp. VK23B]|uniref:glutathione-specific gamma-glutamylcyclotransferase n=1 Tax=Mesorhizobium dulcispinae TaxID=3072316 RepID=A0ABU4XSM2_9HYPH|nr:MULTISPECIES: gamma-glutamylcyclotransferase [unclassified Mesorhizobium]MDX8470283.1 gamma-glutamylcyclotransferase [Mesorhizobium sp. VK23B]MDX8476662.1 gamma-glutamylcyclotransferase [Mesorhizobium sp. VK23A]
MSSGQDMERPPQIVITREFLAEGSFLEKVRQQFGDQVLSDEALSRSLSETLALQPSPGPVWLFAYGSLMWNPAFDYAESGVALLRGWERSFCIWTSYARGTVDRPALTLALDEGGSSEGIAFRIAPGREASELLLVWRREMLGNIYRPEWVRIDIGGTMQWAIAFVANRSRGSYVGHLPEITIARNIASSEGALGTARAYFEEMMRHLDGLSLRDSRMERLRILLANADQENESQPRRAGKVD